MVQATPQKLGRHILVAPRLLGPIPQDPSLQIPVVSGQQT